MVAVVVWRNDPNTGHASSARQHTAEIFMNIMLSYWHWGVATKAL